MSFSCVFFGAFWLDPEEGCENIRAAAPACSLARALRALAGGLSWERLGRLALLGNASEILAKNAPGSLPELTLALLGLLFALLEVIWGLLRVIWGLLLFILTLLGLSWRSRGALGSLWGASWASKSLPNRSRRLSRRPPARELDFGSILGPILAPSWDPPDLKKQGYGKRMKL